MHLLLYIAIVIDNAFLLHIICMKKEGMYLSFLRYYNNELVEVDLNFSLDFKAYDSENVEAINFIKQFDFIFGILEDRYMRAFFGAKCDDEILLEPGTFDKLIKHAEAMLQNESVKEQEHSQAIVAITSNGNVVGCVRENAFAPEISSERLFFKQFDDGHDTEIKKIVVMWSDGSIDMLSYDLRKKLCDLNEKNKNAEMLLPEMRGGYIIRTIVQTLSAQN